MKLTRRHFDAMCGSEITRTIEAAIELASDDANGVEFEFNGVTVHVNSNSNPVLLYREWNRAMRAGHKGPVGPYPAAELTAKELADDAEITAAIEARQRASQQEYMLEMAARRATAERKLDQGDEQRAAIVRAEKAEAEVARLRKVIVEEDLDLGKAEAKVAALQAALASAGRSLISYEASYGGGGGDSQAWDIGNLLGYGDEECRTLEYLDEFLATLEATK